MPENTFAQPAGAALMVMVPVAVPLASVVAHETLVIVAAVTRCSPLSPDGVAPATRMVESLAAAGMAGSVAVAMPLLMTTDDAVCSPKPLSRQASSSAVSAPAVPDNTGAPDIPL